MPGTLAAKEALRTEQGETELDDFGHWGWVMRP
jgi:hypothetical protein